MKSYSDKDGYLPEDLVQTGLDHLKSAKLLFKAGGIEYLDSAGYLAHLGIELLLKAVILKLRGSFPGDHSIENLYRDVQALDPSFHVNDQYQGLLGLIDKNNLGLRYPNRNTPVPIAKGDWPVIEEIVMQITVQLPEPLNEVKDSSIASSKTSRKAIRNKSDLLS